MLHINHTYNKSTSVINFNWKEKISVTFPITVIRYQSRVSIFLDVIVYLPKVNNSKKPNNITINYIHVKNNILPRTSVYHIILKNVKNSYHQYWY